MYETNEGINMKNVIEIIKRSEAAYLATINSEGIPEIRALLNLTNPKKYSGLDGKALIQDEKKLIMYFTTNTSSKKRELKKLGLQQSAITICHRKTLLNLD